MASHVATQTWSRAQVLRLVNITERKLAAWERQELVEPRQVYGFRDLVALRTLESLRSKHVSGRNIQRVLEVLRGRLKKVTDPLSAAKIFLDGKKLRAEIEGNKMEGLSGQYLLDFEASEVRRLVSFPKDDGLVHGKQKEQSQLAESDFWFQKGLDVEHNCGPIGEAIEAYEKAIELNSRMASAMVNLGTIYFHQRKWQKAEAHYHEAIHADPNYALAVFNLGNLYDERGDRNLALQQYEEALRINPRYGDAHYNLALLHQTEGSAMKAVGHWNAYLKLDPQSDWARVARRELDKLKKSMTSHGLRAVGSRT